jgi:hypothetical protein
MKTIAAETQLTINAPLETVWQVMLHTDAYGEWNPFVYLADRAGDVSQPGTTMKLYVRWQNGGTATSGEIVTDVQAPVTDANGNTSAHWAYRYTDVLARLGLVKATRYQWLTQQPGAPTTYRTREEFTGLLKYFIPLKAVQNGFERQAAALKTRAENGSTL